MFENIAKFFKKIIKSESKESTHSKDTAKERLHLVLMQDRANVSADFLELMKQEIIEVIKKYIEVEESAIDVRLTNEIAEDGSKGAPSLYANIPILNIRNDMKKENINSKKEETKEEKDKNVDEETKEEKDENVDEETKDDKESKIEEKKETNKEVKTDNNKNDETNNNKEEIEKSKENNEEKEEVKTEDKVEENNKSINQSKKDNNKCTVNKK